MRWFIASVLAAAVCGCSPALPEPTVSRVDAPAAETIATVPAPPANEGEHHQVEKKPRESHHALALIRLGENLQSAGKTEEAIKFYREAVKKHPGSVQADQASGKILALGGKVPEASECEEAGEPAPEAPHVRKPKTTPHTAEPPAATEAPAPSISRGATVHTGPRGGIYHYSKSGKKVYQTR